MNPRPEGKNREEASVRTPELTTKSAGGSKKRDGRGDHSKMAFLEKGS